jgi:hypothetical protein
MQEAVTRYVEYVRTTKPGCWTVLEGDGSHACCGAVTENWEGVGQGTDGLAVPIGSLSLSTGHEEERR